MADWDDAKKYAKNLGKHLAWETLLGWTGLENMDTEVQEWKNENPLISAAGEFAGFIPAFGAYNKAMKGTKWIERANALASAEKMAMNPFLTAAKKEMMTYAPFEIGRQGIKNAVQLVDPEDFGEVDWGRTAGETIFDVGTAGLLGGTLGKIASAGKKAKAVEALRDIDVADPWQYQLRKVHEKMVGADPVTLGELQKSAWDYEKKILREKARKPIGDPDLDWANQVFNGTPSSPARMMTIGDGGFEKSSKLDKIIEAAGLQEGWIENVQYPRFLDASGRTGKALDHKLQDRLNPVGNGWWMKTEKDGLTVIGKRLDEGKWFVAKTDRPGFFNPAGEALTKEVERTAWIDASQIIKAPLDKENPLTMTMQFEALTKPGVAGLAADDNSIAGVAKKVVERAGGKFVEDIKDNQLVNNVKDMIKDYIYPTVFQFKNSPLARNIFARAQYTRDVFLRKAQEGLFGKINTKGKNVLNLSWKGMARTDKNSLANKIIQFAKDNSEDKWNNFLEVLYGSHSYNEVVASADWRRKLGADGLDVLKQLNEWDKAKNQSYLDIVKALGFDESKMYAFRNDHYGLSHTWKGSIRQAILDERGNLIHIVSGDNKKGVQKLAEGVMAEAKQAGRDWHLGHWWTKNRDLDIKSQSIMKASDYELAEELTQNYLAKNPELGSAGFFKFRAGIGGYTKAQSAEDLIKSLQYSTENKAIYFSNLANEKLLQKDLQILAINDPKTAEMLASKLGALRGEQGPMSQIVNKVADSVLAPVLGTDSASKIVRTLNQASVHLDLGFGNLSYVTANLLQPLTTVLPQLSMLKNCPEAMQAFYDTVPLMSAKGAGVVNIPNPLKIMGEGMRLMAKPTRMEGFEGALNKAVEEGILSPKFIESYIGENSSAGNTIAETFGAGKYCEGILKASSLLPNFSEQASRGYAFSTGYAFFKSMQKAGAQLTDEQVYAGARKLMENTMFQFGAADKARILQGPVGGAWGLFKNWTMHYVGWQMEYLNAGLKHNCWTPWLWSNVTTSMLGGLGASEIGSLAQRFAEYIGDDKFANQLYDAWGDGTATSFMLYGIPGALGFSLQSQVNSPLTSPADELSHFMGMVWWNRLKALGSTAALGVDWFRVTGDNPASSQAFRRQISRAFAPKMLYRQMQMEGGNLMSSSGRKVIGDLSGFEQMMYGTFNLPSVRIQQALQVGNEMYENKEAKARLNARYAEGITQALIENDGRLMEQLIQRACADGLDVDSIMKSAQRRMTNVLVGPLESGQTPDEMWTQDLGGLVTKLFME